MSDEMQIDGNTYISSKRASELSGYAQDYIGQLSRKALIDARRIGGLWYVSMESLEAYKKKAEEYKPTPPTAKNEYNEPGTLVFFDGKEYLSAARAAEETTYTQDYVGQLARSGKILSRQVGNRWYVERESLFSHKKEKDALLAAVQSESVGLVRPQVAEKSLQKYAENTSYSVQEPLLNYFSESGDLMVSTGKQATDDSVAQEAPIVAEQVQTIPIKRVQAAPQRRPLLRTRPVAALRSPIERKRSLAPMLLAAVATIVIVLSVGYASLLKKNSVYATAITPKSMGVEALGADAGSAIAWMGNALEPYLTHELVYQRQ